MGKKENIIKLMAACLIFTLVGIYAGYARMTSTQYYDVAYNYSEEEAEVTNLNIEYEEVTEDDKGIRINPQTNMIYEHYDAKTGETQILRTTAPNFMINKSQTEVKNSFTQWEILSFEEHEVVMRRTVNNKPKPAYTLGVSGEFLAVFYGDGIGTDIKEITNIPVSALPIEEQERLTRGIPINDQDELIRRLEDYSS